MGGEKQRLIDLFNAMSEQHQKSLLDFASFLQHQSVSVEEEQELEKLQPLASPRPEDENVVNAIKRLRASYFMLNTDDLLNQSSTLMAEFMLQGREAEAVINDLEQVFEDYYKKYLES